MPLTDAQYDAKIAAQAKALADAQALLKTPWAQPDAKVGNTKLTQAQTDAAAAAKATAAEITADFPGFTSKVNPITGMVETKSPTGATVGTVVGETPEQKAAREAAAAAQAIADAKAAADKALADKAAADAKAAADKALADKAAADAKAAADKALADAAAKKSEINAIAFLNSTYSSFGLGGDIASAITNLVQQGYTADTIQLIAQDPKSKDPLAIAFQQRFPANAARLNAGLPVLSPAEYLATERSYAQTMQAYGLNSNFATNKDIFTKLLTNDISPTELNSRISTAKQVVENTDPLVTQQLQAYYGISQGDMIAHVLDPSIATPIIEKQISASQIGAGAARAGTDINQSYAEQLSGLGVTQAQANQGFQNIAQQLPATQELAARYSAYGPAGQAGQALQAATFGTTGAAGAVASLDRLKMQEISQFSGSSGAGKGSLMGTEAGLS